MEGWHCQSHNWIAIGTSNGPWFIHCKIHALWTLLLPLFLLVSFLFCVALRCFVLIWTFFSVNFTFTTFSFSLSFSKLWLKLHNQFVYFFSVCLLWRNTILQSDYAYTQMQFSFSWHWDLWRDLVPRFFALKSLLPSNYVECIKRKEMSKTK